MVSWLDTYGRFFAYFWNVYNQTYPDFPTGNIYYEVLVDFWEDVFNEALPMKESLTMAHDYLKEHINDY